MSSRPLLAPYPVIENGNMASSLTSEVTILTNISSMSYSYSWSGSSPLGSITIEVSNDYSTNADGSVRNAGTWNELELSGSTDISGNIGSGFIDLDMIAAQAVRTKYTRISGTGTLQAIIKGKVL